MTLRNLFALILKVIIVFEILVSSRWHMVCAKHFIIRLHFLYTQLGSGLSIQICLQFEGFCGWKLLSSCSEVWLSTENRKWFLWYFRVSLWYIFLECWIILRKSNESQWYSRFYADMRVRKNYSIVLFGNHSQDTLYGKIFYINANCKMVETWKLLNNLTFQG